MKEGGSRSRGSGTEDWDGGAGMSGRRGTGGGERLFRTGGAEWSGASSAGAAASQPTARLRRYYRPVPGTRVRRAADCTISGGIVALSSPAAPELRGIVLPHCVPSRQLEQQARGPRMALELPPPAGCLRPKSRSDFPTPSRLPGRPGAGRGRRVIDSPVMKCWESAGARVGMARVGTRHWATLPRAARRRAARIPRPERKHQTRRRRASAPVVFVQILACPG